MKSLKPDCPSEFKKVTRKCADFLAEVLVPFGCSAIFDKSNRPINRAPTVRDCHANFCAPALLATLLLVSPSTASADTLGRLFFTPQQRNNLDYAYARNAPVQGNASPFLTVNGIVQKQGGARTVWVNGVAQNADNSRERTPTTQTVTLPGKSHPVKIKVGDRVLLDQTAPVPQGTASE